MSEKLSAEKSADNYYGTISIYDSAQQFRQISEVSLDYAAGLWYLSAVGNGADTFGDK